MFDIIGKRNWFFGLSISIFLIGIIGYIINGFTLDIQFKGGTILEIVMEDEDFDPARAAQIVTTTTGKLASGMKSEALDADNSGKNIHILTLNIADSLTGEEQNKVINALRKELNIKENAQMNISNVEPYFGKELMRKSLQAVVWTLLLIIVYIAFRFRTIHGWSSGFFAVVALLHDAMVMLVVYIIFKLPLNDSFIAAVLTILGYSINDTVIIYDRIRENTRLLRKVSYKELVNTSIIQTLSRTINTSAITLMCVIVIYIFAKIYNINTMAEFAFPMIIGLISGTYSTLFIAGPLWVIWREHKQKKSAKPAKV